jgi:general secretion pathway protein G
VVNIQKRRALAGFSLLELLVILVIMGGITGIAMPNLARLYEGISLSVERDAILDQLRNMSQIAVLRQEAYLLKEVSAYTTGRNDNSEQQLYSTFTYLPYELEIPPEWRLSVDSPIIVHANGVCMGGKIQLYYRGKLNYQAQLRPPHCHVEK